MDCGIRLYLLTSSLESPLGYFHDVFVGAFQVEHLPVRYNGSVGRKTLIHTDKHRLIQGARQTGRGRKKYRVDRIGLVTHASTHTCNLI